MNALEICMEEHKLGQTTIELINAVFDFELFLFFLVSLSILMLISLSLKLVVTVKLAGAGVFHPYNNFALILMTGS